jgi:segregation and condensation protein A
MSETRRNSPVQASKSDVSQHPDASGNSAAEPSRVEAAIANRAKKGGEEFPFGISLGQIYDGPLDLLLDLIRKQDIDIYDIPIAQITAQYLAYVEQIKELDVDLASEFIYMASMLIQIKSRMLLPRDPDQPADQDDPRSELVERLLEHEKFKQAAQMLLQRQQIENAVLSNPALKEFKDAEGTEAEMAADVVDLVRTFQQILDRARKRPIIDVDEDAVTVTQMINYFKHRLVMEDRPIRLKLLLRTLQTRNALVCAFLALLEMVRLQAILLRQERVFGEIIIKKSASFDNVMGEAAVVNDDWR